MRSARILAAVVTSAGLVQMQSDRLGLPDLGNLSASAILGWYAWHTAARTLPGLVRNFRDELAAIRAEQRGEREAFREELRLQRQARHADQQLLAAALADLVERLPHVG